MRVRAQVRWVKGLLTKAEALARNKHGNFEIITALLLPVLLAAALGAVDIARAMATKQRMQDALDAAALYVAHSTTNADTDLQSDGSKVLAANLFGVDGVLTSSSFANGEDGHTVVADAQVELPTTILGLFQNNKITIGVHSEVTRASHNVEVALVLDTTGSMIGQKISDLKVAAADLIDIVVQDEQTPTYSKVALVPYSMAVNAGSYAQAVRGSYTSGTCTSPGCQKYRIQQPLRRQGHFRHQHLRDGTLGVERLYGCRPQFLEAWAELPEPEQSVPAEHHRPPIERQGCAEAGDQLASGRRIDRGTCRRSLGMVSCLAELRISLAQRQPTGSVRHRQSRQGRRDHDRRGVQQRLLQRRDK